MAKKAQRIPAVSAKKNAARTPPPAAGGSKRRTEEARAHTEQPRSGPTLRAVTAETESVADEAAPPARWAHLPSGAREVLGLYEQRAKELCFPGVTFESLSAQADRIEQFAEDVETAKLALAAAQEAQQAAEAQVVEATKRAFAYAQVYAQEHAELRTDLEGFAYANADKPRRKKRELQEGQPRGKQAADGAAREAATASETATASEAED